jgi:hypothetical protein
MIFKTQLKQFHLQKIIIDYFFMIIKYTLPKNHGFYFGKIWIKDD